MAAIAKIELATGISPVADWHDGWWQERRLALSTMGMSRKNPSSGWLPKRKVRAIGIMKQYQCGLISREGRKDILWTASVYPYFIDTDDIESFYGCQLVAKYCDASIACHSDDTIGEGMILEAGAVIMVPQNTDRSQSTVSQFRYDLGHISVEIRVMADEVPRVDDDIGVEFTDQFHRME